MATEIVTITRKISKETAKEWGLPDYHSMKPRPECSVCRMPVDWIDCPTGSWYSHWDHPRDDHDAVCEPPVDDGKAVFIENEYQHSGRWNEVWSVVFIAPDDGGFWMTYYEEPSHENGEGMDPWGDAEEIELIHVNRRKVVKFQWMPTVRPEASAPRCRD